MPSAPRFRAEHRDSSSFRDQPYREVPVRDEFPSCTITFFQFGALMFGVDDLRDLALSQFIAPDQIAKLKRVQRIKLTLPTKGIVTKGSATLIDSVRRTLHQFFLTQPADGPMAESLKWLLFEEYRGAACASWSLASCPHCGARDVPLEHQKIAADLTTICSFCGQQLYLTDVFRLHEAIDNELGAGGVLGYLVVLIEQMILVHLIRTMLLHRPSLLREVLFLKDGPLGFFGQTANMFKPMRALVTYLHRHHDLYLVGAEKSGAFVEHADAISARLAPNTALLLSNEYIYKHIVPGEADPKRPYGSTTYYGTKLIYRTTEGRTYVLTLPTDRALSRPKESELKNLHTILKYVAQLRCDMYDASLVPVALVNKLVSLADHPSTVLLEKFARATVPPA